MPAALWGDREHRHERENAQAEYDKKNAVPELPSDVRQHSTDASPGRARERRAGNRDTRFRFPDTAQKQTHGEKKPGRGALPALATRVN